MQPEMISSSDETQVGEAEVTKASGNYVEKRKSSKPVMEKRRRARINNSLNQLKNILLEALKKDCTRHSKLEKADILEMTVTYLKNVERQRLSMSLSIDPNVVDKYKAGFNECRNEVMRFLSTCEGVTVDVRTRLLSHLASCIRCIQSLQTQTNGFEDNSCESLALQTSIFPTNNHGSIAHNITVGKNAGVFSSEENLRFSSGLGEPNADITTSFLRHEDQYDQSVPETRSMASTRLNNVGMVLPEMVKQGSMPKPDFRSGHFTENKNNFSSPKRKHLKEGNPVSQTSFPAVEFSINATNKPDPLSHHFPQHPSLGHSFSPPSFPTKIRESVDSEQNASSISSCDSINSDREASPRENLSNRSNTGYWTNFFNFEQSKTQFHHFQSTRDVDEKVSLKRSNFDDHFEDNKRKRPSKHHTLNKSEHSELNQRSFEQIQYSYSSNNCEYINRNNEFSMNCAMMSNRNYPESQNPLKKDFKNVKHDCSESNAHVQTTRTHFKKSNPWRPWSDGRSLEEKTQ